MKRSDIDRKYTELVAGLLGKGYQIHTATMKGGQGEEAHVDLTNGSEILRVLLENTLDYERGGHITTIKVGRNTDTGDYIWNERLETRFEIRYYKVTDDYYTTVEEGRRGLQIHRDRYRANHRNNRRELGEAFKSPALRWLRRTQKGFKSVRLSDIESVTRIDKVDWTEPTGELYGYEIKARGKAFTLKAPRS